MKAVRHPKKPLLLFQDLNNFNQIKIMLPNAKQFDYKGKKLCAVKHTLDNAIALSKLGYKVDSPISYDYEWKGRYKPFKHQHDTAAFLTMFKKCFVLNDIGTGKSLSALWAADYLMSIGVVNKVLIVSPLSTLERVWADEIFTHFFNRQSIVLHGTAKKRKELLAQEDTDFYIINHDGLRIIEEDVIARNDIDLIIVDECAVYRNARTDKYTTLRSIVNKKKEARLWMMTGTPTPNAPTDAWAQIRLVNPDNVPKYFTRFRSTVMYQINQYTWLPKKNSAELLKHLMQPAIRFNRDDCIDLPETIYSTREVDLSTEQRCAFTEMAKMLYTQIQSGEVTAANEAVKTNKLIQICCGVAYDNTGKAVHLDARPRLRLLNELIEQAGQKVIVFVPLTAALDKVKEYLLNKGWTVEFVDRRVSKKKRDQIFADFQRSANPHVLVAHPKTMAHGLTLTEASTIVWFAPYISPEYYTQANGRITRSGQRNVTNIVHIESTATERKLYSRLKAKKKIQGVLLDSIEEMMS